MAARRGPRWHWPTWCETTRERRRLSVWRARGGRRVQREGECRDSMRGMVCRGARSGCVVSDMNRCNSGAVGRRGTTRRGCETTSELVRRVARRVMQRTTSTRT
eukprot:7381437-Prymnesium_polylepis.2